jgi:adenylate kinase
VAADPAADDDEDDEALAKLKEELAATLRVLALKAGGRFVDAALATMLRYTLATKACRNQGYVLDNFPKTVRQASTAFVVGDIALPEPDEDGLIVEDPADADPSALIAAVDDALLFDTAVVLAADEALLEARCGAAPDALAEMHRRLAAFKAANTAQPKPPTGFKAWLQAIQTNKEAAPRCVSLHEHDTTNDDAECSSSMAVVTEAIGAPRFIHPTPVEILQGRRQLELDAESARLAALVASEEQAARDGAAAAEARKATQNDDRRLASVGVERREAAAMAALPMQAYLVTHMLPAVTAAMQHVAELRPDDPVDSLADRLFHYVPNDKL